MSTIQLKLYEALAVLAVLLGICVAVWFAADSHYSKQYVALKAQYEQAAKDQKSAVEATIAENNATNERITNELKQKLVDSSASIADLGVRLKSSHNAIGVCTTALGALGTAQQANGSGIATGTGAVANPAPAVAIDSAALDDALRIGIDALTREQAWRDYARSTGQGK